MRNFKRTFLIAIGFILFVYILTYFQIQQEQTRIKLPPPEISVSIVSIRSDLDQITADWQVNTSLPLSTLQTGIYYSPTSTPSALTHLDSPAAVGYENFTPDYQFGRFSVPDQFSAKLALNPDTIYYGRAYALVDGRHYWSEEFPLVVK